MTTSSSLHPAAQPELLTPRLCLRGWQAGDAEPLAALADAFEVADTTARLPHPYTLEDARWWIGEARLRWVEGSLMACGVLLRHSDELVGTVGLQFDHTNAQGTLGYWIGVAHWRCGYATEAASALVDYGFRERGLHRIQANHMSRNPASGQVMRKLGMRHEGCLREAVRKWDRFEDMEQYGLLASEWRPLAPRAD